MTTPHHHYGSTAAELAPSESDTTLLGQSAVIPHEGAHGHAGGEFSHPASLKMLFAVFFALLALTGLTVYQSTWDLGNAEIYLSLLIATVKAGLVIMFFMHMLWDKLINGIIFFSSLIFVALFLGVTLTDATQYKDFIIDADTLLQSIPKTDAAE